MIERISHYRLISRIGRGAMGEVYRAVDERLGRAVALKLLPRALADTPTMQARLIREARAASTFNHPGIVTVHDIGAWHGRVFMVMELVEGERLSDLAKRGIPIEEALRLTAEVADALGVAHARDVLHRDVKSDNLMRTQDGRVKVLDFGVAKLLTPFEEGEAHDGARPGSFWEEPTQDPGAAETLGPLAAASSADTTVGESPAASDAGAARSELAALEASSDANPSNPSTPLSNPTLTRAGELVGTPAYMSPEQTRGAVADAQGEVFSLGVVLYELLVGARPFDRASLIETIEAVREAPVPVPSQAAPQRAIPVVVDAVVLGALERDRAKRWPDMPSFARALRRARADLLPSEARPRRWLGVVALIALVCAAGGAAVFLRMSRPPAITVASTRHLTFDPGCEEYPSFSPDGATIVYDGLVGTDYEVLALDLATGRRRQLTHAHGWDYGAQLSPDGRSVVYQHNDDAGNELRVMPIEGDAHGTRSLGPASTFTWEGDETLLSTSDGALLMRYRLSASGVQQEPAVQLPKGTKIRDVAALEGGYLAAIWQPAQQTDFVLGELPPSGEPRIVEAPLHFGNVHIAASPRDRRAYYYVRHAGNANELLRRRRGGGAAVQVPGGVAPAAGFALSRDGKRLAYSSCNQSDRIAVLRDGVPEELIPRGQWLDLDPDQIDDHRYVFASNRSGAFEVWLFDTTTREAKPLTGPGAQMPAASHDGERIVYADEANHGIFVIPTSGGAARRITDGVGDQRPQLSSDDRTILFLRHTGDGMRYYAVPITGGEARPITPVGVNEATLSPVSDEVVFLQPEAGSARIMITDLRGAPPRPAFAHLAPAGFSSPRISPDGKRLLLGRDWLQVVELELASPDPTPRVLWNAGTDGVDGVRYTRDGKVLVSITAWDGDLWLAEGDFP